MTMADSCIECDVAIVGSGFAGALIANELSKTRRLKVVVLEAGPAVPPNINDYMRRFYNASAKVPESPYPPELFANGNLRDPATMPVGRPTVLTLGASNWQDPTQSYLIQQGPRPFTSTYERIAGGTSHWLGTSLRFAPADFRMESTYGKDAEKFPCPDWPKDISYDNMTTFYERAEAELGVSADTAEQTFAGITFRAGHPYPMPRIPGSLLDQRIGAALSHLTDDETRFLGMKTPVSEIKVRSLPAARNSQPYRNRRACAGNTNCIPICPIQAKYDPTISLNDATSRNDTGNNFYTRIMPHTVASEIVVENRLVDRIEFIRYEGDAGPRVKGCVKAKVYVIAGNAIETPRLLLMSRGAGVNGVANSSGMVGRNLMDHPYYVAWGLLPQSAEPVYPYRGPLITSGIGDLCDGPFRAERAAFRVDIGNEGWNFVVAAGQFGSDPNVTALDFVNGMNASGLNQATHSGLAEDSKALFGVDLAKKLNSLIIRQFRIGFLVEQNPDPENRVTLSAEHKDGLGLPRPQISYNISDYTRSGIVAAYRMKNLIFAKLGATDFTVPGRDDPARFEEMIDGKPTALTYTGAGHIMGTCRMGGDARTSVVDANQCSHDHYNLFLVGSSTFPTGATANPTLTIAALSMKTADAIIGRF
jgi:glucose dehydrogenase